MTPITRFLILILLFAGSSAMAQDLLTADPDGRLSYDLVESGYEEYSAGNYPLALRFLRLATDMDSTILEAWFLMGNSLYLVDNLPEALAMYKRVLAINPFHAVALSMAGTCLSRMDRQLEAEEMLRASLRVAPEPQTWMALARVLEAQDADSLAGDAWRQAIAGDPRSIDALLGLADWLRNDDRDDEAITTLLHAHAIDSSNTAVMEQLGSLEVARENWEEAASWFLRSGSDSSAAAPTLHAIWTRAGRSDIAARFRSLVEAGSAGEAQVHARLATGWLVLEFLTEGIREAELSLQADSLYAPAHYLLLNASLRSGDDDKACEHYRRLQEINPRAAEMIRSQLLDDVDLDSFCNEEELN